MEHKKSVYQLMLSYLNPRQPKIQISDVIYSNHTNDQPSNITKAPTENPFRCSGNRFKTPKNWEVGKASPDTYEQFIETQKCLSSDGSGTGYGSDFFGFGLLIRQENSLVCIDNDIESEEVAQQIKDTIKQVLGISNVNTVYARNNSRFKVFFHCTDKQNLKLENKYYSVKESHVDEYINEKIEIAKKQKKKVVGYYPEVEVFYNFNKFCKIFGHHVTEVKKAKDGQASREFYLVDTEDQNDNNLIYKATAQQLNDIFNRLQKDGAYISASRRKFLEEQATKDTSQQLVVDSNLEEDDGKQLSFDELIERVKSLGEGERDTELCDPSGSKLIYKLASASLKFVDITKADNEVNKALFSIYGGDTECINKYNTYKKYQEKFATGGDQREHKNGDIWCVNLTKPNGQIKTIYKMMVEGREVSIDYVLYQNIKEIRNILRKHLRYDISTEKHLYDGVSVDQNELDAILAAKGFFYIEKINKALLDRLIMINDTLPECQVDTLKEYFQKKLDEVDDNDKSKPPYMPISKFIVCTNLDDTIKQNWKFGDQIFYQKTEKEMVFAYILMSIKFFALHYRDQFDEAHKMIPTTYPVFIGKKGIGKTHLSRILATDERLFVESLDLRDDNEELHTKMKGHLIAEFGEVDQTISKRDFGSLKTLVRSQGMTYRVLYTNRNKFTERRTYMIFTANNPQYIQENDERGLLSIDVTHFYRDGIIMNLWADYKHCDDCHSLRNGKVEKFNYAKNLKGLQDKINEIAINSHKGHEQDSIYQDEILNAIQELLMNPSVLGQAYYNHQINDEKLITNTNILTVMRLPNSRKNHQLVKNVLLENGYTLHKSGTTYWIKK